MRKGGTDGMVYAVSQSESLSASHERRLADLRDRSKEHRLVKVNPEGILPNPKFVTDDDHLPTEQLTADSSVTVDAPKASLLLQRPRKPTTAANFFRKEGKENDKKKETAKPVRKRQAASKQTADTKPASKSKPVSKAADTTLNVGTVDDFQGDMDDDDDDDSSVEAPRKPKSPTKKAKTEEVVRKPKPAYTGPVAKQRRKVRKTRFTTDEKGYMITEHYEEWEDVPSDEEAPKPIAKAAPKKKAAARPKPTLKQGSLAGFFKKA